MFMPVEGASGISDRDLKILVKFFALELVKYHLFSFFKTIRTFLDHFGVDVLIVISCQ